MPPLPSGTLTFLFTDIEGSTRLWEEHGDAMQASLALHNDVLATAVERAGGQVFKLTGDGICAVFSSAGDAIEAALAAQEALGTAPWSGTPALRVRIGLHTGDAMASDGDYSGPTLNRVARVMDAGHGGQILASSTTHDAAHSGLDGTEVRDLGPHRLRDLSAAERLYQVGGGDFPRLRTLDAIPNNLPAQVSSFVGRRRELDLVRSLLHDHRLVTLTGVGGTGKTRLALQVAADVLHEFEDGVFFVELATVRDASLVAERVANSVAAPSLQGELGSGRAEEQRLVDMLRNRGVLLVLDNCEHVVDATARLVDRLLTECADVRILATSREALGIVGEQAVRVPSLAVVEAGPATPVDVERSEAGSLLLDRTRLVDPAYSVSEADAPVVAEICRRLDGIPLAIELAAARVASLSAAEVLERLDDQFRILTGGSRTAVERHQTLRAAIDWSFDLLSEQARTLVPRLSVFSGGWTLEAAEEVTSDEALEPFEVLDAMSELVDKSLLSTERGEGPTRYGMVEPVRQYASERLAAEGTSETWRERHAAWVVARTSLSGPADGADSAGQFTRAMFVLAEYANFTEATRWLVETGDVDRAARSVGGGALALLASGQYREGLQLLDAVSTDDALECWLRYFLVHFSVYLALWLGQRDSALERLTRARRLGETCPDVPSLYWVTLAEATMGVTSGELTDIEEHLAGAREEARAENADFAVHYATFLLGIAYQSEARYEESIEFLEDAYRAMAQLPIAWVPYAMPNVALSKVLAGHDDAGDALEEAEKLAREAGDPAAITQALVARTIHVDAAEAREALREILEITRTLGLRGLFSMPAAAVYAHRIGHQELAARALGGHAAAQGQGAPLPDYLRVLAEDVERGLGTHAYEQAWRVGTERSAEEILEEVVTAEPGP